MNEPEHLKKDDPADDGAAVIKRGGAGRVILRVLAFVFATLLLLTAGLYGVMWVLVNGPSPTAGSLFVRSVRETSAIGFLAGIYLSDEEIAQIEQSAANAVPEDATDASLITITDGGDAADGEAVEIIDVSGPSYRGKLMIVSDPSRVFVGTPDGYGGSGLTLAQMGERYDVIGGVNGGGFDDPGGSGNGGRPEGVVIAGGTLLSDGNGRSWPTAVIDSDGVLHVGTMTAYEAQNLNAREAVSFGPALIVNGEKCSGLDSGLNPRTAIGQRADGAILLLVIDGRQVDSLGATYGDTADLLLEYGAVNAMNLDGGSSSSMLYEGEIITVCASVIGARPLPTAILVSREAAA